MGMESLSAISGMRSIGQDYALGQVASCNGHQNGFSPQYVQGITGGK